MHINCPHCKSPVEIVESGEPESVTCPSCGSMFQVLPETAPLSVASLGSIGRFVLLERVGQGHFGQVWKARDETLGRNVAIKMPRLSSLDGEYRELFLREARSVAQLRHPNIVTVLQVERSGRNVFIVSEFIEGVTLANLILHRRPESRRAAEILKTVALAVDHAHERGIIHRDLKPGN